MVLQKGGALVIRRLCTYMGPDKVFRQLAAVLEPEPDLVFASTMVQAWAREELTLIVGCAVSSVLAGTAAACRTCSSSFCNSTDRCSMVMVSHQLVPALKHQAQQVFALPRHSWLGWG
jgi:hypothetical protein